ncbi:Prefoldin [Aspergillus desertorum]
MADPQKHMQTLSDEYQGLQTGTSTLPLRPEKRSGVSVPSTLTPRRRQQWLTGFCTELDGLVEARQKLESQQQENKSVQAEFNSLDGDANIFKLIGPVLLKQDKSEALMAVNGRLEFIEKEIQRIEGQIKENQDKSDKKRAELVQYQSQIQQQAAAASASF